MAPKSDKENKGLKKSGPASSKPVAKPASKKIKEEEDDGVDDEEVEAPKTTAKKGVKATASKTKKKSEDDDDDDEAEGETEDEVDEWDKVEEDEEWDPDFDEFDVPRSKTKKAAPGGKKAAKGEEDELGLDEEYKNMDLFNDNGFDEEEEDF
ncbi:MAG TPA: hypothetical protein VIL90_01790 [Puia sp.]|jgi:hypothetical protein